MSENIKAFEQACQETFTRYLEHAASSLNGDPFVHATSDSTRIPIDTQFLEGVDSFRDSGRNTPNINADKWRMEVLFIACMMAGHTGQPAQYTCWPLIQHCIEQYVLEVRTEKSVAREIAEHLKTR